MTLSIVALASTNTNHRFLNSLQNPTCRQAPTNDACTFLRVLSPGSTMIYSAQWKGDEKIKEEKEREREKSDLFPDLRDAATRLL